VRAHARRPGCGSISRCARRSRPRPARGRRQQRSGGKSGRSGQSAARVRRGGEREAATMATTAAKAKAAVTVGRRGADDVPPREARRRAVVKRPAKGGTIPPSLTASAHRRGGAGEHEDAPQAVGWGAGVGECARIVLRRLPSFVHRVVRRARRRSQSKEQRTIACVRGVMFSARQRRVWCGLLLLHILTQLIRVTILEYL
jgi:hypothetical protein